MVGVQQKANLGHQKIVNHFYVNRFQILLSKYQVEAKIKIKIRLNKKLIFLAHLILGIQMKLGRRDSEPELIFSVVLCGDCFLK